MPSYSAPDESIETNRGEVVRGSIFEPNRAHSHPTLQIMAHPPPNIPAKPKPRWFRVLLGRNPAWTAARALALVVASFVVFKFVLLPIRVTGQSMTPAYRNGGVNFINRLAYRKHKPERGDVVAFSRFGPHVVFLKRIVGLPGEHITVTDGKVTVNGRLLDEPYVKEDSPMTLKVPVDLLPDEYLAMGDNRKVSEHFIIQRGQIVGKVLF